MTIFKWSSSWQFKQEFQFYLFSWRVGCLDLIWSSHEELLHEQQDHMVKLKAKINGENNWKVFDWWKKWLFKRNTEFLTKRKSLYNSHLASEAHFLLVLESLLLPYSSWSLATKWHWLTFFSFTKICNNLVADKILFWDNLVTFPIAFFLFNPNSCYMLADNSKYFLDCCLLFFFMYYWLISWSPFQMYALLDPF